MNTYADDLAALTEKLDLKDRSMSGTPPAEAKLLDILDVTAPSGFPKPCSLVRYHR
jgi:hypothetical protein